jgi:hypothetical protein|uniref:Uncharacterized protein n=1 Tax=Picea sitchensis TaxID=3332 RepID=A0A6B9XQL6_PICSI|nr:hypothetical protein Q903MT_gene3891 [Picea sitchensis]
MRGTHSIDLACTLYTFLCATLLQPIEIFYMELKLEGVLPMLLMGLVLLIIELNSKGCSFVAG